MSGAGIEETLSPCGMRMPAYIWILSPTTRHSTVCRSCDVMLKSEIRARAGRNRVSRFALLHALADPVHYDRELKIWLACNSSMAEGQWHSFRPSELGFVDNMRTSWSQASAASVGSWSTEKYLPMAVVENTKLGVAWFCQMNMTPRAIGRSRASPREAFAPLMCMPVLEDSICSTLRRGRTWSPPRATRPCPSRSAVRTASGRELVLRCLSASQLFPSPSRVATCGEPVALSATESEAEKAVAMDGVKVT